MQTITLLAPFLALALTVSADFASVSAAIDTVNTKLNTLNSQLQATDGRNVFTNLGIHNTAVDLTNSINSATTEFQNTPSFTVDQATTLISTLQKTESTTATVGDRLIVLKPGFDAALSTSILKGDVASLKTATTGLSDAAIAKAPAEKVADAQAVKDGVLATFAKIDAAYA